MVGPSPALSSMPLSTAGVVDRITGGTAGSLASRLDGTPRLELAARQLALNLMRKGSSLLARFRCDDFVDNALLAIEEPARSSTTSRSESRRTPVDEGESSERLRALTRGREPRAAARRAIDLLLCIAHGDTFQAWR